MNPFNRLPNKKLQVAQDVTKFAIVNARLGVNKMSAQVRYWPSPEPAESIHYHNILGIS